MRRIIHSVNDIMRDETNSSVFPLTQFLWLISCIYGSGVRTRGFAYEKGVFRRKQLPCKVISIGNITVGGTGKTPMSMFVAKAIQKLGYRVAVISRGYKGGAEKAGGIVSDGRSTYMTPDQAGDEPYLMATKLDGIPVLVGKNRFRTGQQAIREFQPDAIVLDDAFQHLALERDINLLLFDYAHPFGNRHLIPRGTLREPLSCLSRADAFILTRSDTSEPSPIEAFRQSHHQIQDIPTFASIHEPHMYKAAPDAAGGGVSSAYQLIPAEIGHITNQKVFAFSGIASHEDFLTTIGLFPCQVVGHVKFPDHHRYHEKEMLEICHRASNADASMLLTTEKDYVRIAQRFLPLPLELIVVGIKTAFGADTKPFVDYLQYHIEMS